MTDLIVLAEPQEIAIREEFLKGGDGLSKLVAIIEEKANKELADIEAVELSGGIEEGLKMRRRLGTMINKSHQRVDSIGQEAFQAAKEIPNIISKARQNFNDAINSETGIRTLVLKPVREIEERKKTLTAQVDSIIQNIEGTVSLVANMTPEQIASEIVRIDGFSPEFFDEAQETNFNAKRYMATKKLEEARVLKIEEVEKAKVAEELARKQFEAEAEERARKQAAEREAQLIQERERAEAALKQAEIDRVEAEKKAEADRIEAEQQAERDRIAQQERAEQEIKEAQERAEREKQEAIKQAEAREQAKRDFEAEQQRQRAEDKENQKRVNNEIVGALVSDEISDLFKKAMNGKAESIGITEEQLSQIPNITREQAVMIVFAIATGRIPNISVTY